MVSQSFHTHCCEFQHKLPDVALRLGLAYKGLLTYQTKAIAPTTPVEKAFLRAGQFRALRVSSLSTQSTAL